MKSEVQQQRKWKENYNIKENGERSTATKNEEQSTTTKKMKSEVQWQRQLRTNHNDYEN